MSNELMPMSSFVPPEYANREPIVWTPEQTRARREEENKYLWEKQEPIIPAMLISRGAPWKLVDKVFSRDLDGTDPLLVAERFEKESQLILLLTGGTRRGKSLAAVWLMSRRMKQVRINVPGDLEADGSLMWTSLRQFESKQAFVGPDALTAAKSGTWTEEYKGWAKLLDVDFLVVDDLGVELQKVDTALNRLLSSRMEAKKKTVLTTNLTASAFRGRYGDRLSDRINEVGLAHDCGAIVTDATKQSVMQY